METIMIHPLEHIVVQRECLHDSGFALDRLTDELRYEKKLASSDANTVQEALEDFKRRNVKITGGKKRFRTIPQSGWVEVQLKKDWDSMWKKAMETLRSKAHGNN